MKIFFIKAFCMMLLCSAFISASEPTKVKTNNTLDNTVKSLMLGLESDNLGLKTGSAFMIGELKVESAVIPLMKMLKNEETEEARIVAALALYKLGTPMGIYSLRQASRFDESVRVRKICLRFYLDFVNKNKVTEY